MKLSNSRITIVICSKDYSDPAVVLKKTNLLGLLEFIPIILCFYQDSIRSLNHKNLKIIKGKKNGIYSSFNSAIKLVDTSHYIIIGDDDKFIGNIEDFTLINRAVQSNNLIYLPVKKGKKVYSYFKKQNWNKLMIGHFPSHSGGIIIPKKAHEILGFYETEKFRLCSDILFIRRILRSNKFLEIYIEKVLFDIGLTGASSNFKNSLYELYKIRNHLKIISKFYNIINFIFLFIKFSIYSTIYRFLKSIYRTANYYYYSFVALITLFFKKTPIKFRGNKFRIFLPGPSVNKFKKNEDFEGDFINIYVNNSYRLLKKFKTKNNYYFTSDVKRAEEFINSNDPSNIRSILYPVDFFQLKKKIVFSFDHVILPKLSFSLKYGLRTKEKNVAMIGSLLNRSNRFRYGFGSLNSCLALIFGSVKELEIWGADFSSSKGAHFKGHKGFIDLDSPFVRMKNEFFTIVSKLDCTIKINGKSHSK